MKILIISDAWLPQVNGVVQTYENIITELEKMGHQTMVIGPSDFPLRIPLIGYTEIKLALFPYGRLKKKIEAFNPDSIHVATEGPLGMASKKYCLKHRVPFSTSYHTQFPDYVEKRIRRHMPFLSKTAYKIAVRNICRFHSASTALLVTTKSMAEELQKWGIKTPIHFFTRGVNQDWFFPPQNDSDRPHFKDLKKPIALYVGRIAIEKSIEDFLDMEWDGSKVVVGHGPDTAVSYTHLTLPTTVIV